jgi:hypothetical protein
MKRNALVLMVALAVVVIGSVATADAHKLKAGKARQLTQKIASSDCSRQNWCTSFGWECRAGKGPHRVPCKEHLIDDPNRIHCVIGLTLGLYPDSNKIFIQKQGRPHCFSF